MMRNRRAVVALVAVALSCGVLGSCSEPPPMDECTDQVRTAGEPGDAEPLLILGAALGNPLVVYADGAVAWSVARGDGEGALSASLTLGSHGVVPALRAGYTGDQPGGFVAGWLSPCELSALVTSADALLTPDVDFGVPQATDPDSTPIAYLPTDGEPVTVSVYLFNRSRPQQWTDLTDAQQQARTDLAVLWNRLEQAIDGAEPLPIDRLAIARFGPVADEEVSWTLPPLSQLAPDGCAVVDDPDDVAEILGLLADNGALIPGEPERLAAVAVPAAVNPCDYWG